MKKLTFFALFLVFLGAAAWGDTFVWIDGWTWNTPGNWYNETLQATATRYPGDGSNNDIVYFTSGQSIQVQDSLILDSIIIDTRTYIAIGAFTLTVNNLTLNNNLDMAGTGVLSFTNLTMLIGIAVNGGTFHMNGATVTLPNYPRAVSITGNNVSTGIINAPDRTVSIDASGNLNIGGAITAQAVSIEASGNITIGSGGINAGTTTTGVIRLESGGGITINGPITGHQLIALANPTSGTVAFGNYLISITNTTNNFDGSLNDKFQAPIYVRASDFTASGTDTIIPGIGQLCLELGVTKLPGAYDLPVVDQKYHIHGLAVAVPEPDKHLVYYNGAEPTDIFTAADHYFVQASSSPDNAFSVDPGRNIYIYNVGTNNHTVTFTVAGAGFIEIRGNYSSTAGLVLHPGSEGVRLYGATVSLGNDFNTNGATLTLENANSTITAPTVTLGGTVTGNSHSLTINGNAVFNDVVSGVAALSVSGTSTINANITTTGNQTYSGAVTLGGTGARTLQGTIINFNSTLTGTNQDFTINGASTIGGNVTTTTGTQTYNGAVTLTGDRTFTANTGILIWFNGTGSTVRGNNNTTGRALTITNANVQFDGAVGVATGNGLISTLSVNAGTANINANIYTTGTGVAQSYNGSVVLGANVTFTGAANSTVQFHSTVNGNTNARTLAVAAANVIFDGVVGGTGLGSITIGNATTAGTTTINAASVTTTGNGTSQRYYGPVVLGANVNFTGTAAGSTIRFDGTVNGAYGLSVTATTTRIVMGVTTTGNQTYIGAVTLGSGTGATANSNVTLNATGTTSKILFNGTITSNNTTARALTITSADVQFDGNVGTEGNGNPVSTLTVNGTATINADVFTSGNQSYAAVNLGSTLRTLTSTGGSVHAAGIVNGSAGITVNTLQGITMDAANTLSGNVTLNNTQTPGTLAGDILFHNTSTAALNLTAVNNRANRTITVNHAGPLSITSASTPATGSISLTTTGAITQTGAITTGTLNIETGGAITLNAANTAAALHITAAGGAVQFTNNAALSIVGVSGLTPANLAVNITTTGAGHNITQTGAITTTGTLTINSSGSISQTGAGAITTANTLVVNSSGAITLDSANHVGTLSIIGAGGAVQFTNNAALSVAGVSGVGNNNVTITASAGNITQTGSITTGGAATLNAATGDITQSGAITTGGAATLNAVSGGITINGTIDSSTLSLIADTGTVNIVNDSLITVTGGTTGDNHHDETAGVYITANSLTGNGGINLSPTGWACAYIEGSSDGFTGPVSAPGIHYHPKAGMHIVYRSGNRSSFTPPPNLVTDGFLYIEADNTNLGDNNDIRTTLAGNIYIIDVDNNPSATPPNPALTRVVSFSTDPGGHIEIWGNYRTITNGTDTGELTLKPGIGIGSVGVVLINAEIDLVHNFDTNGGTLHIDGTNSIKAANITLHGGIEGTDPDITDNLTLEATSSSSSRSSIEGNVGYNFPLDELTVKGALTLKDSHLRATSFTFDNTVTINGTVALDGPVRLANNVTFSAPSSGTAAFTQINEVSGPFSLTFSSGANSTLTINQVHAGGGVSINGSVNIAANSNVHVQTASGAAFRQAASKVLTLGANAVLDTSAGSWHLGTSTTSNDFAGIDGALILGANSKLTAHDLNLTGSAFEITNTITNTDTDWTTIGAKGNALITGDVDFTNSNFPYLIIEMDGNGTQTLTTEIPLGSLHIGTNSRTRIETGGQLAADNPSTIIIRGMVKISAVNAPAGLDAGNYNIVMYAGLTGNRNLTNYTHNGSHTIRYARWENTGASIVQPPYSSPPDVNNFIFRQNPGGRVSFQRDPGSTEPVFFEIAGNSMWREFECSVPGAVVQFSRHPDHHTVLDDFSIGNQSSTAADHSDYVTITRLTDNAYINYPYLYDSSMGPPPLTSTGANVGDLGAHALPVYYPPLDLKNAAQSEKEKYWNINFVTVSGPAQKPLDNFRYVRIFFSHAYNQRIPIETSSMHLDAVPYYRASTGDGYFNFDWIELRKILYSFTEDSSGDGRLDRIRVQTNVRLNGDFSAFEVNVEGYQIDTAIGTNGFRMVSDLTGYNDDEDSFYIYLRQVPYIDGGNTPLWSVTRNGSLKDLLTESSSVGDPEIDVDMRPFDTIPPRISHTLTLPGYPQTYIRMSEPVLSPGGNISDAQAVERSESYIFTWKYFPYDETPVSYTMPVVSANLGYLLNLPSSFDIEALSRLKNIFGDTTSSETDGYFRIDNVIDQGQRAMDWHDPSVDPAFYIYYQPPKYPLNWAYTEYAKVYGNSHLLTHGLSADDNDAVKANDVPIPLRDVFLPPNKMLSVEMMTLIAQGRGNEVTPQNFASYSNPSANDIVIRRITDVLVSLTPASGDSENYFAWPVWARYQDNANPDNASLPVDFWSQRNTDTGVIWTFDGTAFLEARGLELQARMNSVLTGSLELFWTTDIPTEYRIPQEDPVRGRSTGGLWLPYPGDLQNKLLYYFAPLYDGNAVNQSGASAPANPPLFNFALNAENSSGKKMEFVFRINGSSTSDLFIARLDIPRTGAIPENWYYLVRPFGFDIQDIRLQRGGVTILNNVINSDARENAFIRYHLVRPGRVTVQVYTLDGTLVKSLRRNEYREAGEWTDAWDGTNNSGRAVARGMYFVRVVAPDIDEIRKIMVVR